MLSKGGQRSGLEPLDPELEKSYSFMYIAYVSALAFLQKVDLSRGAHRRHCCPDAGAWSAPQMETKKRYIDCLVDSL